PPQGVHVDGGSRRYGAGSRRWSGRRRGLAFARTFDAPQPGFLPEEKARGLTFRVRRAVAALAVEMDGALHAPDGVALDGVAGLVGRLVHPESAGTVLQQLRPERQAGQRAVVVPPRPDLPRT